MQRLKMDISIGVDLTDIEIDTILNRHSENEDIGKALAKAIMEGRFLLSSVWIDEYQIWCLNKERGTDYIENPLFRTF